MQYPFLAKYLCTKSARYSLWVLLFLIVSCSTHKDPKQGYSKEFKPVFDTASSLFAANKINIGIHYLDSAIARMKNPGLDDRFRTLSFHFVYWQKYKHDFNKSLLYADSMLAIAKESTTHKQYVANYTEANMAIGDAYFANHRYSEAYRHYFEGFRVGKNNLNNKALSDYSYRMGMILYKMGNFKLAASYFKESYRLQTTTSDRFADFYRIQEVLDNIGISYKHNNEPDSAIVYFDKALKFIDQNAAQFANRPEMISVAKAVVFGNKAEVLIAKGDYAGAASLLKKSIAINLKKGNDNNDAELSEIKLADIYLIRNQIDSLHAVLMSLNHQFDSVRNQRAVADWNRLMSRYSQNKGEFSEALAYLRTYNILEDSIASQLNLLKESNVNEQLANFEKQYQIDILKEHDQNQRLYLYAAMIGGVMAIVIIFLIYRNWKRSRDDVKMVNDLNRQINIQKLNVEKTNEELRHSSLEKDRILRAVAHDLRNPIGGIASLSVALEDEDILTAEQREMIKLIHETATDTLILINEILEATSNGQDIAGKMPVDINALLNKSVELLRFKAAEKDQTILVNLSDQPATLVINREKIWRVLSNLISNAIKFSANGSSIYVSVADNLNDVTISVRDEGIGIPEEIQQGVFNMFSDAKRPGTAGEKSFGLGLSISKKIIEDHGGDIWFESAKGVGTTFFIRLSRKKDVNTNPSKSQPTSSLMS